MSEVLDINEHFKRFGLKEGDIVNIPRAVDHNQYDRLNRRYILPEVELKMRKDFGDKIKNNCAYLSYRTIERFSIDYCFEFPFEDIIGNILKVEDTYIQIQLTNLNTYINYLN